MIAAVYARTSTDQGGEPMRGMFTLRTATDLLAKLRHDHSRVRKTPRDAYAAFDFFVTAEHLPEWLDPPEKALRKSEPLLRVVSHLANGAKHIHRVDAKRHRSVTATGRRGGYFNPSYWAPRYFGALGGGGALYVELDERNDAAAVAQLGGRRINVLDLADEVLKFWTARLEPTAADPSPKGKER